MIRLSIMFQVFLLYPFIVARVDENSPYFNTSFLINYDQVTEALHGNGFESVTFQSEDHLALQGLFLQQPQATHNVLLCAGFYPGRKEGLAAFYHLLSEQANIFLFDARGHGKSEGTFLSSIFSYGIHEYKDVVGAAEYLWQTNQLPTIIIGVCAGAYHATRATSYILKEKQHLPITGLVLDSSIVSLHASKDVPSFFFKQTVLPSLLQKTWYNKEKKQTIKQTSVYAFLAACSTPFLKLFEWILSPCISCRDKEDIRPLLKDISIPTFIIHAQDDEYIPFDLAHSCTQYTQKQWWPEHARHACIYLQHKHAYAQHLEAFIENALHYNRSKPKTHKHVRE